MDVFLIADENFRLFLFNRVYLYFAGNRIQ